MFMCSIAGRCNRYAFSDLVVAIVQVQGVCTPKQPNYSVARRNLPAAIKNTRVLRCNGCVKFPSKPLRLHPWMQAAVARDVHVASLVWEKVLQGMTQVVPPTAHGAHADQVARLQAALYSDDGPHLQWEHGPRFLQRRRRHHWYYGISAGLGFLELDSSSLGGAAVRQCCPKTSLNGACRFVNGVERCT